MNQIAKPTLSCLDVTKDFTVQSSFFAKKKQLRAVDHVSFSLNKGECLGLVGESGCGKSTLGRISCGLLEPTTGCVQLFGSTLPPAGAKSWAAGQIQMVFQDPFSSLNPRLKVIDSVSEPLAAKNVDRKDRISQAEHMLDLVGLVGCGKRYPHEFSGGQRQRIAIARAVITKPAVIICDEAVSALDASVQAQILNLLKDMQEQFSPAYLFISHDLNVVGYMCERILVMYLGRILEEGSRKNLFENPAHPYTQALLAARNGITQNAQSISGDLPSPLSPPNGCVFHPRCPKATALCQEVIPKWQELAPQWRVRCHHALS